MGKQVVWLQGVSSITLSITQTFISFASILIFLIDGHYGYSWQLQPSMILDRSLGALDDDGPYRKPAAGLGTHQGTVYAVCGCSGQGGLVDLPRHPVMAVNQGGFGSMVLEISGL